MAENRSDKQPGDSFAATDATPVAVEVKPTPEVESPTHEPPTQRLDAEPATATPSREDMPTLVSPVSSLAPLARDFTAADAAVTAEHERLIAERVARRKQRQAALAARPEPVPEPTPVAPAPIQLPAPRGTARRAALPTETVEVVQRSNDKWAGSLGLFLVRLVCAAIMGVHGANKLLNLPAATENLQNTILPQPGLFAIVIGAAEIAIAIALVFGLLTRVAGLGVALIAGGALALVKWGPWSPFKPGQSGFDGELELLLVVLGVLFLLVGGGGWSVDRGFRASRSAR